VAVAVIMKGGTGKVVSEGGKVTWVAREQDRSWRAVQREWSGQRK
jgi:hypothetical protein